jgi:hypothetical protein
MTEQFFTISVSPVEMLMLLDMPHRGITATGMFRLHNRTMSRHEIAVMFYKCYSARRNSHHKNLVVVKKKGVQR